MVPFDKGFYLIWHLLMGLVGVFVLYKLIRNKQ